jgi:hypothetical protein
MRSRAVKLATVTVAVAVVLLLAGSMAVLLVDQFDREITSS